MVCNPQNTPPGATVDGESTHFCVWAPKAQRVEVVLEPEGTALPALAHSDGMHRVTVHGAGAGALYKIRLDNDVLAPDPWSRYQPLGVHGPSMVIDPASYQWKDQAFKGVPPHSWVLYELHVGTFSPEGTFAGLQAKLPYLRDLGVNAIELMPCHDFDGRWNWGYDPAAYFAPCRAYGACDDLRALVDCAHDLGLAMVLDVVYNHLGPAGAYLPAFGPVFTDKHHTPWGRAINLDGEDCAGVREFFLRNAMQWFEEYHFDGLRLDATHALIDDSPTHVLTELAERAGRLTGRPKPVLIAEDPRNLRALVMPASEGGLGCDAVWVDDFHHQVRCTLTQENESYYGDFTPGAQGIGRCITQGWLYTGQFSKHQGAPRGTDPAGLSPAHMVYCIQNHDQVGNRATGDRLHHVVSAAHYRTVSALLLFAPQLPMLFMGQEWATSAPFQFFTDHEEELGKKVTAGRRAEFKNFKAFAAQVPDPQDPQTFQHSVLPWQECLDPPHAQVLRLYKDLLRRRESFTGKAQMLGADSQALVLQRDRHTLVVSLGDQVKIAEPRNSTLVWHTESAPYTDTPMPPTLSDGFVHCPGPLAALFERLP